MEDSKNNEQITKESRESTNTWKEYNDFYEAHNLQLYGMNFPVKELGEKLYFKLKNEIFDSTRFFEVMDNQDEARLMLKAKIDIKKNMEILLVDHCWTFKLRQFDEFCEKYPQVIDRVLAMLKYGNVKRDIPGGNDEEEKAKPVMEDYIAKLKLSGDYSYLEYDNMGLTDLLSVYIDENTEALSLEGNKLCDLNTIIEVLGKYKNVKAVWLDGNEGLGEEYEAILVDMLPQLEIINRKFNKNTAKWGVNYISKPGKEVHEKYDELYQSRAIDLSGRDPLAVADLSIFRSNDIEIIDLRDNGYTGEERLVELIQMFPNAKRILCDECEDNVFNTDDTEDEHDMLTSLLKLYEIHMKDKSSVIFLNDYYIPSLLQHGIKKIRKHTWVRKHMWRICQTYRLMTSEKYDEDAIWYINDEIGSTINHSDIPNVALFPFIYSPSNTFKDDMITYSLLWPLKDIRKNDEISRDYLTNITEDQQRSARLTCWFNTPKEYFRKSFDNCIEKLSNRSSTDVLAKCTENVDKLRHDFNNYNIAFDFTLLENKVKSTNDDSLVQRTNDNVKASLTWESADGLNINTYFLNEEQFGKDKKIKVFSDLPYVRDNLKHENFEITMNVEEADIVWLNTDYFKLKEGGVNFKNPVFKNQFPFESIVTMKNHIGDLLQSNLGLVPYFNLTYNLETQLAEVIGNYYYNSNRYFDNTWILKPINMSRSMDMIVSSNLDEIIRSVETGPKICQKYIHNPFLMNKKKFDLRFIVLLKRLVPLELYFYSKRFWVRSANKEFVEDPNSFTDYQTHFTVMNYGTFGLKTIYDTEFVEYLTERGVEWMPIYEKIKQAVKEIFLLAGKDCPQMVDPFSRAIYGLDVMIDETLQTKVLELNYSPDCTRACVYHPEFFDDIFSTLFLGKEAGVELVP
jgi:tubulin--tyrosine ligase-like protein 12